MGLEISIVDFQNVCAVWDSELETRQWSRRDLSSPPFTKHQNQLTAEQSSTKIDLNLPKKTPNKQLFYNTKTSHNKMEGGALF